MKRKPIYPAYRDHSEHLADELRYLDVLLRRAIRTQSLLNQSAPEDQTARAVYVSPAEVEWLLGSTGQRDRDNVEEMQERAGLSLLRTQIDERTRSSRQEKIFLPLAQLSDLFALSAFERDVIVICLAPELQRKYDRLYAFMQDDITRKRPSVDLVLQLLCNSEAERWKARSILSDAATLLRSGLLEKVLDPHSPSGSSGLAEFLRLDSRICEFLVGGKHIDARLAGEVQVFRPPGREHAVPIDCKIVTGLERLVERQLNPVNPDGHKLVLHLHGPQGVGKRDLALHLCRSLGCALLQIDAELLLAHGPHAAKWLRLVFRESLLQQAALLVERADAFLQDTARPLLNALQLGVVEYGWLVFLSATHPWTEKSEFPGCTFHSTALPMPDVPMRAEVWKHALKQETPEIASCAMQLAAQFRLTPRKINAAVELARIRKRTEPEASPMRVADLTAACREQSNHKLRDLAVKIEPNYGWDDLVLPADKILHLREICSHVRLQYRVLGRWGFGNKLGYGKGVSVLFTGPSGTGKTMAAEVLARDLELDLYKVDLSGLVSKYIGETEKNLNRIFEEAETSSAILFFDEADALFGKRTKVSDAHDRYANIETAYLLQKFEEHEGVVILATNLAENVDEAFTRRIRFRVEFPFPDQANCLRIWQTHFPAAAPLSAEIDFSHIAREFKVAGGNIKNIALNAAFLAAADGGIITSRHIMHGTRREFEKMGKPWRDELQAVNHGARRK
jgi:SpoVK/Ycf46/Vps4 family AAA+-type ATPase